MTTRNRYLLAAALLILPILARLVFYYHAPYFNASIPKPDYASFTIPQAPTPSSRVAAAATPSTGKVVLIDNFHANQFTANEIEPLVTAINAQGASVELDDGSIPLEMELKYASAYMVFAPTINFSAAELRQVQQFVTNGGRLMVFADPTRALMTFDLSGNLVSAPDVNYLNPLIASYGLTLVNDYLYDLQDNEGNFRNVKFTKFAENPLTSGMKMAVFYGAHSVRVEGGNLLATGDEKTLSSLTDTGGGLSPIGLSANGQVLALGDFSFIANPFNQVADNQVLVAHLADFATGGERSPALANFPFLFQHPANLVTTGDLTLSADILEPLAKLQQALKAVNIPIQIHQSAQKDGDAIVLGVLEPSKDLAPYLKPFNINLEKQAGGIDIPGLGTVGNSGVGLLLFNHSATSNTLILLASSADDMPALIELVAGGDLSACLLQENTALCNLGTSSGSGSSDFFGGGDFGLPTETPTEPAITETPTPSG